MPPSELKHPGPIDVAALAALFQAVAQPTRAHVLLMLGDGERHVGALCVKLGCTMLALSHHLTRLRSAGLIAFRWHGPRTIYSITESGREMLGVIETLGPGAGAAVWPRRGLHGDYRAPP